MAEIKDIIKLKNIFEKDSETRQDAIQILFNALRTGFTSKTIGAIQPLATEIPSITSAISRAKMDVRMLNVDEKLFTDAVEILEQEYEYFNQIYNEYFVKSFAKEVDIDWVRKNIQVDKLRTLVADLNNMKVRENTLLTDIDKSLAIIAQKKRDALRRIA